MTATQSIEFDVKDIGLRATESAGSNGPSGRCPFCA